MADLPAAVADTARYVPSLSGDLDAMRGQIAIAREAGVDKIGRAHV